MRVLELFGGYGSQALALENLGYDFTSDLCEIDKYAIQAYNQLHGETKNLGDICKIDETQLPHYDLITYSSPCQDFSVAGKQAGGDKGSGTRSSLLWECERIIRAVKPKYLLMENVKNLVGKKHIHNFTAWLRTLESMGYQNWWKVLNAKDYGVPQNRERVFVVSIFGGGQYQFPDPIPLTKRLKDVLEQNVDEKYYLSDEIVKRFTKSTENQKYPFGKEYKVLGTTSKNQDKNTTDSRHWVLGTYGVSPTIDATQYKTPKQFLEPMCCASRGRNPDNPSDRTIGSPTEQRIEINTTGTTNTITTVQKDNYVIVPEATKQGYAKAYEGDSINLEQPNSQTRRGRVGHQMANTLTCSCNQGVVEPKVETHIIPQTVSVRKYDVDIEKLQTVLRLHKECLDLTNRQIAEKLDKPLTNVEHWFRTDDGFSIPEKDVWFSLKELLKIGTDEFDDSITTFEEKENVFEKANRCYGVCGVSPTLTATSSDEKIIEPKIDVVGHYMESKHEASRIVNSDGLYPTVKENHGTVPAVVEPKVMQVGNIVKTESFGGNPQRGRIYSSDGCSPALNTCQGGGLEPKITEYRFFDQAIKTAEEKDAKNGDTIDAFNQRVNNTGVCPTLTTRPEGFKTAILPVQNYRIRKLTPRECWRLMGVKDEQFDKLHDISNSQLYKMAGNSIVVDVLMGIFKNMFEPTEQKGQMNLL